MLGETMMSTLMNLVLLAGIPFLVYALVHRIRYKRGLVEIAKRAGLTLGDRRYIGYCAAAAVLIIAGLLLRPPSLEPMTREGSSWLDFSGLGFSGTAIAMALLYGVLKTGFAEEFLFRGIIAGSLSRHMSFLWANLLQALIFLAPHLLILAFMPEMWPILPLVFAGALFSGWARIRSGSIVGPWLLHAAVNVTMGLSVAARSGV